MKDNIKNNIYNAQCYGNVEPIEYMTPYSSTQSLIEGQNIRGGERLLYSKDSITNFEFYELVQKTAHWLEHQGISYNDKIYLSKSCDIYNNILLFGVWQLGGVVVIGENKIEATKDISQKINLFDEIKSFPSSYQPKKKPILNDIALIYNASKSITLSHYNLLINTSGIQKRVGFKPDTKIHINIPTLKPDWVIFNTILPIYSNIILTNENPDVTFSKKKIKNCYYFRDDLMNIEDYQKNEIGICFENTAVLSFGNEAIHMTNFEKKNSNIYIRGHSVMMGYTQENQNRQAFKEDKLKIYI